METTRNSYLLKFFFWLQRLKETQTQTARRTDAETEIQTQTARRTDTETEIQTHTARRTDTETETVIETMKPTESDIAVQRLKDRERLRVIYRQTYAHTDKHTANTLIQLYRKTFKWIYRWTDIQTH